MFTKTFTKLHGEHLEKVKSTNKKSRSEVQSWALIITQRVFVIVYLKTFSFVYECKTTLMFSSY